MNLVSLKMMFKLVFNLNNSLGIDMLCTVIQVLILATEIPK